jgi:hypothetical protein
MSDLVVWYLVPWMCTYIRRSVLVFTTASNGCQFLQIELHPILPTADICILNLSIFPTRSPAAPGACSLGKALV